MRKRAKEGQGATEYLVLLAIVLVICLVTVSLLNFFPVFSADARMTESQYYWKAAKPIQILDSSQNPYTNTLSIVVNNGQSEQLRILDITVDGNGAIGRNNTTTFLAGGEKKVVRIAMVGDTCVEGSRYEYDIILTYQNQDGTLINKEYGDKKLVGKCATTTGVGGLIGELEGNGNTTNGGSGGGQSNPPGGGEPLPPTCGLQGQGCCPPAGTCGYGLVCRVGSCEDCGGFGQTCCNNNMCDGENFCLFGTCF